MRGFHRVIFLLAILSNLNPSLQKWLIIRVVLAFLGNKVSQEESTHNAPHRVGGFIFIAERGLESASRITRMMAHPMTLS